MAKPPGGGGAPTGVGKPPVVAAPAVAAAGAGGSKPRLKLRIASGLAMTPTTTNPMLVATAAAAGSSGGGGGDDDAMNEFAPVAPAAAAAKAVPGGGAPRKSVISVVSRNSNVLAPAGDGSFKDVRSATIRNMSSDRFMKLSVPEQAAVFEHQIVATTCSPIRVIRREFGRGISGYFMFVQYIIAVNVVLAAMAGGVFGYVYASLPDRASFSMFFTGLYPTDARKPWLATTSAIVCLPALAGLLYPLVYRKLMSGTAPELYDMTSTGDMREDLALRAVTYAERRRRRLASAIIFTILVAVQAAITYALFAGLRDVSSTYSSLIIAFSNNALNFMQKFISKRLTRMEMHSKVTTHREADTKKLFALKFINVIILYVLKSLLADDHPAATLEVDLVALACAPGTIPAGGAPGGNGTAPAGGNGTAPAGGAGVCACPLVSQGWTFFWLLVFDVAFSVAVEPLVGLAIQKYRATTANKRGLSDYDTRLDFDVAEELVSVLYRQFIILLGAPVFPLITAVGVAGYVVEYYLDRAKLINLCKKTIIREESMDQRLIVVCTIIVSLAAAFSFPQGLVFTSMGYGMATCRFFA